jgi:hypothetical protein
MVRRPRQHRASIAATALAAALLSDPECLGQIEGRLQAPDGFSRTDSISAPFSREYLRQIPVDSDVLAAVALLESEHYAVREAATEQLLKDDERRMQLYALLAGDGLTVEQRYRVLQVVRDQLVNTPRGALGIEMAPFLPARGEALEIRINNLIAGLPAERVLQVGDRIIAIDSQPLFMEDDLQNRVQSKRPGEKVSVMVRRPKVDDNGKVIKDAAEEPVTETLVFEIELGSAEILDQQRDRVVVRPSTVQASRRIEAKAIMYAYAPQPLPLTIRGGAQQMAHEDPIDDHPAIINLLIQQEMLADRNEQQVRMMRDMWVRQLADIVELSNHPGLSEPERDKLRKVAERFTEIMNGES